MAINWNTYFMKMATLIATRSKCKSRKVGAILVKDRRIIATGYNGPPSNIEHCTTCKRLESGKDLFECMAIHAEENVLIQAAMYGPSVMRTTLYTTLEPCKHCAKLLIQAKIENVYYKEEYDGNGMKLLKGRIKCYQIYI